LYGSIFFLLGVLGSCPFQGAKNQILILKLNR
jgi:hypothetical protein